jgi:hypothetical protein
LLVVTNRSMRGAYLESRFNHCVHVVFITSFRYVSGVHHIISLRVKNTSNDVFTLLALHHLNGMPIIKNDKRVDYRSHMLHHM